MIKFLVSFAIVLLWILAMDRTFPSDHENANTFTIGAFLILACWILGGILFIVFKRKAPSIHIFGALVLINCILIYNFFPWYKGYTGIQIIKDYSIKKKSIKEVDVAWIYSLSARIENFPLIDLAQRKFADKVNPDKCYLFQCIYTDSNGIQKYIDQFVIYFKDKKPYTTKPSTVFTQKSDDSYELVETINGNPSAIIFSKNGSLRMVTTTGSQLSDQTQENYYLSDAEYVFKLMRTDPSNGFNIRKAYWIYKFL